MQGWRVREEVNEKAGDEGNCGEKRRVSTCTQHANWCDLCETFNTLVCKDTCAGQGLVTAARRLGWWGGGSRTVELRAEKRTSCSPYMRAAKTAIATAAPAAVNDTDVWWSS